MARTKSRRLDASERLELRSLAEEMLLERWSDRAIIRALADQYGISHHVAAKELASVTAEIQQSVADAAPRRRAQQIASLDRLYQQCVAAKRFNAAIRIQALLAKIEAPTVQPGRGRGEALPAMPSAPADDEFAGRSESDLNYYCENGHWPEEAPEAIETEAGAEKPGGVDFPLH